MDHVRSAYARGQGFLAQACHLSSDKAPEPCAGFVAAQKTNGCENIGLRIAVAVGCVKLDNYGTDTGALHPDLDAVLAAHPDPCTQARHLCP